VSFFNKQVNEYHEFKYELCMKMQHQLNGHGGVIDSQTRRVVHFSNWINVLRVLRDGGLSSILNITKNYDGRVNHMIDPWNYVVSADNILVFDAEHGLSEEQIQSFILWREKAFAYEYIYTRVEYFHISLYRGELKHQTEIYQTKAEQAKLVFDGVTDYQLTFFVHDWADLRGIDLIDAAKEIKFKNDNAKVFLAAIEQMRLKYIKMVSDEHNFENIAEIIKQFDTETYVNAAV
jgi:hypothetical protein